ncbi:MAG: Asp-tRNA(Asn)/Glu-tRNA(Gln) amidotransferase subunit GatA [Patescibacteria group bacterium]
MDLNNLTIKKARELLDKKEISAKELAENYLKNVKDKNQDLNVYLEVYDDVLKQAEVAQKIINDGKAGALTGIPFAIKDNILIKGRKASAASKILENYTATYTATAAQKLIDQGVVFLGRANMDEFAMGGSTENSAFGVTKNPLDTSRVAGGSSGGSSAAVASNMALGALGSDTGGSVREPASFCGMVGLKPTYGFVSRFGLMAMGSSLDVIGPITKTVTDAEIIFNAIKGKDKMDSTSIDVNPTSQKLRGAKVGVPYHILEQDGISDDVRKNFDESIKKMESLGFEIVDIKLPNIDKSLAIYYIIMPAEVSSNMSRYDGIKYGLSANGDNLLEVYKKSRGEGFGREVRRRIILGTYVLSSGYYDAYYGKAMFARKIIREEFEQAFKEVDAILTPTTPAPAWKIGEKTTPLQNYLADIFTVTANITGVPAISLPSGFSRVDGKDLPLGVQLMASHGHENILFEIGKKFLNE